ncbi:MAG: ROK family protein [Christensenellaceae bacterium]|jgi:glucokinase|nr:ROK family protein [Christensenellaceae bacterium]
MYAIGIDIGGMSLKGGIVSKQGEIIRKVTVKTVTGSRSRLMNSLFELTSDLLNNSPISRDQLKSVGVGVPGTVEPYEGHLIYSNNIKVSHVDIGAGISQRFAVGCAVENDANCAALGEMVFGCAKSMKNIVFITLGTGVGTGIVVNRKIHSGAGGAGGEGGHMVIKKGGLKCTCGRKGCWEAYASATALIRETTKAIKKYPDSLMSQIAKDEGKVSGRTAFRAAEKCDAQAINVVDQYIEDVACGITNLVNIFRPDAVIIGGGISNEGDFFINEIIKHVNRDSYGSTRNPATKIVRAELKNDAGILGAAALCLGN